MEEPTQQLRTNGNFDQQAAPTDSLDTLLGDPSNTMGGMNTMQMPQKVTYDDEESQLKRVKLIQKAQQFATSSFAAEIGGILGDITSFEFLTNEEIEDRIDKCIVVINGKGNKSFGKVLFLGGVNVYEKVMGQVGYDMTGLSSLLAMSKEADILMEEILLSQKSLTYIKPEVKLLALVAQKSFEVAYVNDLKKQNSSHMAALGSQSTDLAGKYPDL